MDPIRDTYATRRYRGGYIHICHNRSTLRMEYRAQLPDGKTVEVKSQRAAEMAINAVTK